MLRRSLFVSALMLAGVVSFASSAKAVDQPVNFSATIDAACNLTAPAANSLTGTLVPNAAKTALSTTGGTPAYVGLDCSDGTLSIADPVPDGANPVATTTHTAAITTATNQVVVSPTGTGDKTAILAAGDTADAMITMDASGTAVLTAGSYTYTVLVTAVP
jgi:hypothetical protein